MMNDGIPNFPRNATPEERIETLEEAAQRLMRKYDQGGGATTRDVAELVSRLLVLATWNAQRAAALERSVRDLEDHLTSSGGPHVD